MKIFMDQFLNDIATPQTTHSSIHSHPKTIGILKQSLEYYSIAICLIGIEVYFSGLLVNYTVVRTPSLKKYHERYCVGPYQVRVKNEQPNEMTSLYFFSVLFECTGSLSQPAI